MFFGEKAHAVPSWKTEAIQQLHNDLEDRSVAPYLTIEATEGEFLYVPELGGGSTPLKKQYVAEYFETPAGDRPYPDVPSIKWNSSRFLSKGTKALMDTYPWGHVSPFTTFENAANTDQGYVIVGGDYGSWGAGEVALQTLRLQQPTIAWHLSCRRSSDEFARITIRGFILNNVMTGHQVLNMDELESSQQVYRVGLKEGWERLELNLETSLHSKYTSLVEGETAFVYHQLKYYDEHHGLIEYANDVIQHLGVLEGDTIVYEEATKYWLRLYNDLEGIRIPLSSSGISQVIIRANGTIQIIDRDGISTNHNFTLPQKKGSALDLKFAITSSLPRHKIWKANGVITQGSQIVSYSKGALIGELAFYGDTITTIRSMKAFSTSGEDRSVLVPYIAWKQSEAPLWPESLQYSNYSWRFGDGYTPELEPFLFKDQKIKLNGSLMKLTENSLSAVTFDETFDPLNSMTKGYYQIGWTKTLGYKTKGWPSLFESPFVKRAVVNVNDSGKISWITDKSMRLNVITEFPLKDEVTKVTYAFTVKGQILPADEFVSANIDIYVDGIPDSSLLDWTGKPAGSYYALNIGKCYIPVRKALLEDGHGAFTAHWAGKSYLITGQILGCTDGVLELKSSTTKIMEFSDVNDLQFHDLAVLDGRIGVTLTTRANSDDDFSILTGGVPSDWNYTDQLTNKITTVRFRAEDGTLLPWVTPAAGQYGLVETRRDLRLLTTGGDGKLDLFFVDSELAYEDLTYASTGLRPNPDYIPETIPNPDYAPESSYYTNEAPLYKMVASLWSKKSTIDTQNGLPILVGTVDDDGSWDYYYSIRSTNPNVFLNRIPIGSDHQTLPFPSSGSVSVSIEHGDSYKVVLYGIQAGDEYTVFSGRRWWAGGTAGSSTNLTSVEHPEFRIERLPNAAWPVPAELPNPDYIPETISNPDYSVTNSFFVTDGISNNYYRNSNSKVNDVSGYDGSEVEVFEKLYPARADDTYNFKYFFACTNPNVTMRMRVTQYDSSHGTPVVDSLSWDVSPLTEIPEYISFRLKFPDSLNESTPYSLTAKVEFYLDGLQSGNEWTIFEKECGTNLIGGEIGTHPLPSIVESGVRIESIPNPEWPVPEGQENPETIPNPDYALLTTEMLPAIMSTVQVPSGNTGVPFSNGILYKNITASPDPTLQNGYTFVRMVHHKPALEVSNGKFKLSGLGLWYSKILGTDHEYRNVIQSKVNAYFLPDLESWRHDSDSAVGPFIETISNGPQTNLLQVSTAFDASVPTTTIRNLDSEMTFKPIAGKSYLEVLFWGNRKMIPLETNFTENSTVQILTEKNRVQVSVNGTVSNFVLGDHPFASENRFVRFTYWNREVLFEAEPLVGTKMTYSRYCNETLESQIFHAFAGVSEIEDCIQETRMFQNTEEHLELFEHSELNSFWSGRDPELLDNRILFMTPYGLQAQVGTVRTINAEEYAVDQEVPTSFSLAALLQKTALDNGTTLSFKIRTLARNQSNGLLFDEAPVDGDSFASVGTFLMSEGFNYPGFNFSTKNGMVYSRVNIRSNPGTGKLVVDNGYGSSIEYDALDESKSVDLLAFQIGISGVVGNTLQIADIVILRDGQASALIERKQPDISYRMMWEQISWASGNETNTYDGYGLQGSAYRSGSGRLLVPQGDLWKAFLWKHVLHEEGNGIEQQLTQYKPIEKNPPLIGVYPNSERYTCLPGEILAKDARIVLHAKIEDPSRVSRSYPLQMTTPTCVIQYQSHMDVRLYLGTEAIDLPNNSLKVVSFQVGSGSVLVDDEPYAGFMENIKEDDSLTLVFSSSGTNYAADISYLEFQGGDLLPEIRNDFSLTPSTNVETSFIDNSLNAFVPFRHPDDQFDTRRMALTSVEADVSGEKILINGKHELRLYNHGSDMTLAGLGERLIFSHDVNYANGTPVQNYRIRMKLESETDMEIGTQIVHLLAGERILDLKFYAVTDETLLQGQANQNGQVWWKVYIDDVLDREELFFSFEETAQDSRIRPSQAGDNGTVYDQVFVKFAIHIDADEELWIHEFRQSDMEQNRGWYHEVPKPTLGLLKKEIRYQDIYLVLDDDQLLYREAAGTIIYELPMMLENAERYGIDLRVAVASYGTSLQFRDTLGLPTAEPTWFTKYEEIRDTLVNIPTREAQDSNSFAALELLPIAASTYSIDRHVSVLLYNTCLMTDYPLTAPQINTNLEEMKMLDVDAIKALADIYAQEEIRLYLAFNQNYHSKNYMYGTFYTMVDKQSEWISHYHKKSVAIYGPPAMMNIDGPYNAEGYPVYVEFMKWLTRPTYNLISDIGNNADFTMATGNLIMPIIKTWALPTVPLTAFDEVRSYQYGSALVDQGLMIAGTPLVWANVGYYQQDYGFKFDIAYAADRSGLIIEKMGSWNADNLARKREYFKSFYRKNRSVDTDLRHIVHVFAAVRPDNLGLFGDEEKEALKSIINRCEIGDIFMLNCITNSGDAYPDWGVIKPTIIHDESKRLRLLVEIENLNLYPDYPTTTYGLMGLYNSRHKVYWNLMADKKSGNPFFVDKKFWRESFNNGPVHVMNITLGQFDGETYVFPLLNDLHIYTNGTSNQFLYLDIGPGEEGLKEKLFGHQPIGYARTKEAAELNKVLDTEFAAFQKKHRSIGHVAMNLIGDAENLAETTLIRSVKNLYDVQGAVLSFVGYAKQSGNQPYDVGLVVFGRFYGIKLNMEPTQYSIYLQNDKTPKQFSDDELYGPRDILFEVFEWPEDSVDPTQVKATELLIVDGFTYDEPDWSSVLIYAYADDQDIVIDRIKMPEFLSTPKNQYRRPIYNWPRKLDEQGYEQSFDEEPPKPEIKNNPGKTTGAKPGKPGTKPGGSKTNWAERPPHKWDPIVGPGRPQDGYPGDTTTTTDPETPDPVNPAFQKPVIPIPKPTTIPTPNLPVLPDTVFPPANPEMCARDWIKDLVLCCALKQWDKSKWDQILTDFGTIEAWLAFFCNDLQQWTVLDSQGNAMTYIINEDKGCPTLTTESENIAIELEKTFYTEIDDWTLEEPGSKRLTAFPVSVLLRPSVEEDPDYQYCRLNGLRWVSKEIFTEDDYSFIDATGPDRNPYDRQAVRLLEKSLKGDVNVVDNPGGVIVSGGWIGQKYEGAIELERELSFRDGEKVLLSKDDLVYDLRNFYDEIYTGPMESVDSSLSVHDMDEAIVLNWEEKPDGVLLTGHSVDAADSVVSSKVLNDQTPEFTFYFADLVDLVPDCQYDYRLFIVSYSGKLIFNDLEYHDGDNVYFDSMSDSSFTIKAGDAIYYSPWTGETSERQGQVNGLQPYVLPYDGKEDLIMPMEEVSLPDGLIDLRVHAEIIRTDWPVICMYEHEVDPGFSDINGDIVYFSSDKIEPFDMQTPWTGAEVKTEPFVLKTLQPVEMNIRVYNPKFEAFKGSTIGSVVARIASSNPNVQVLEYPEEELTWGTSEVYKDIPLTIKAVPSATIQWFPTIHAGHYYLNQHERFLHVNAKPIGIYKQGQVPVIKDVVYAAELSMKSKNPEGEAEIRHLRANEFAGQKTGCFYRGNGLECSMTITTPLYQQYATGTYISKDLILGNEDPVEWGMMTWNAEEPAGTEINMYLQAQDTKTGIWGPWIGIENGAVPVVPLSQKIRYMVKLNPENDSVDYEIEEVDNSILDFLGFDGISVQNVTATFGQLECLDKGSSGTYISAVKDYGVSPTSFDITAQGTGSFLVEFATADTKEDLVAADWHTDDNGLYLGRYVVYRVSLVEDAVVTAISRKAVVFASMATSPKIGDIRIRYVIGGNRGIGEIITQTIAGRLAADAEWHEISNGDLRATLYPSLIGNGYRLSDLMSVDISSSDSDVEFLYDPSGSTPLLARTATEETIIGNTKWLAFEDKVGLISPVPQQFSPVLVQDETTGTWFVQSNFTDANGKPSLFTTETSISDGRSGILLGHNGVDISSVLLKVDGEDVNASELSLVNNILVRSSRNPIGSTLEVRYALTNSFTIDPNFSTAGARIQLHTNLPTDHILVYAEASEDRSTQVADTINMNPLYAPNNHGFVYLSDEATTASQIQVSMNPSILSADGMDTASVFARILDVDGNPVSGEKVIVEAVYGKIILTNNVSDPFGVVSFRYVAPLESGVDTVSIQAYGKSLTAILSVTLKS